VVIGLAVAEGAREASVGGVADQRVAVPQGVQRRVGVPVQGEAAAGEAQPRVLGNVAGVGPDRTTKAQVLGAGAEHVAPPIRTPGPMRSSRDPPPDSRLAAAGPSTWHTTWSSTSRTRRVRSRRSQPRSATPA